MKQTYTTTLVIIASLLLISSCTLSVKNTKQELQDNKNSAIKNTPITKSAEDIPINNTPLRIKTYRLPGCYKAPYYTNYEISYSINPSTNEIRIAIPIININSKYPVFMGTKGGTTYIDFEVPITDKKINAKGFAYFTIANTILKEGAHFSIRVFNKTADSTGHLLREKSFIIIKKDIAIKKEHKAVFKQTTIGINSPEHYKRFFAQDSTFMIYQITDNGDWDIKITKTSPEFTIDSITYGEIEHGNIEFIIYDKRSINESTELKDYLIQFNIKKANLASTPHYVLIKDIMGKHKSQKMIRL